MKHKLQDLAKKLDCRVLGDCSVVVSGVASLQSASSEDLVFVEDAKCLDPALASAAGAVIAGAFAENAPARKPVLLATQPRLAFARAAKLLSDAANGAGTHPSAVVAASARIGNNVVIGAGAIVGENARIGDESSV